MYANDRYKMAGQWFGLPKLFPKSVNEGYEIVRNDDTLIQFKNKQVRLPRWRCVRCVQCVQCEQKQEKRAQHQSDWRNGRNADRQTWGFHLVSKEATIVRISDLFAPSISIAGYYTKYMGADLQNALVSLVLDPATKDSDFPLILYHKE